MFATSTIRSLALFAIVLAVFVSNASAIGKGDGDPVECDVPLETCFYYTYCMEEKDWWDECQNEWNWDPKGCAVVDAYLCEDDCTSAEDNYWFYCEWEPIT